MSTRGPGIGMPAAGSAAAGTERNDYPRDAGDAWDARGGARTEDGRSGTPLAAVPRRRLLARLETGERVVVLRAPAGFGKTTLLAQWLAPGRPEHGTLDHGRPEHGRADRGRSFRTAAWASINRHCGDAASVWASVVDALVDAQLPLPSLAAHRSPRATAERMLVEYGKRRACDPRDELVLVLDGFENVADEGLDLDLMEAARRTPGLRLVVALRGHRHFRGVLDVRGGFDPADAAEVSAHDLRFTVEEIRELVDALGVPAGQGAVEGIHAATGGWPELSHALVLEIRDAGPGAAQAPAVIDSIAARRVLGRLLPDESSPQAQFALRSSVPAWLTPALASALAPAGAEQTQPTGRQLDGQAQLAQLERDGVLLTERQGDRIVYRWPDAARAVLREQAQFRFADELPQLHTRLASALRAEGEPGEAVRHAALARNWPLLLEIMDASWRELLFAHRDALFEALTAAPLEVLSQSVRALALRDIRMRVPDDLLLKAAPLPSSPEALSALGRSRRAVDIVDTGMAMMTALRHRGLLAEAAAYADRICEVLEAARQLRPADVRAHYPAINLAIAVTRLLADDIPGAFQPLEKAAETSADDARGYVGADAASKRALAHAVLGEPAATRRWLDRYRAAPLTATWLAPVIEFTATTAAVLDAMDRLDLAAAARAESLLPPTTRSDEFWAFALYAQTQYTLHTGGAGMLTQIDRARAAYRRLLGPGASAGPLLAAAEVSLLLAEGAGNQALAVLRGEHAGHPLLQVGRARLALMTGDLEAVGRLASDRAWQRVATARDQLEMMLLHAVAAHRSGERDGAAQLLERAALAAGHSTLVRPFATVPRADLVAIAAAAPSAARLLEEPAVAGARVPYPDSAFLVHLTEQEQRVLTTLAEGLTVEQTAAALVISANTVKTHIRSLYRKLGADSRADAVARGRAWGLLGGFGTS